MTSTKLPLEGIRVADFSWFGAGPIAGAILANFGAEVIRVESETHVDGLRVAQPVADGKTGYNVSGYYNNFNAGKLSFTLNLSHPMSRDIALRLIAKCDIVMENYAPRVFEKWGLTYDAMREVNPSVIFLREPMMGTWGPHRDFAGFGAVLSPIAGLSHLSGYADRTPIGIGTNYSDYVINPGHAALAMLAALRHRQRTGEGQQIELSQLESTAAVFGQALMEYSVNRHVRTREGNKQPNAAPHNAYPCAGEDRWIVIACFTDDEWSALVSEMGQPEWARSDKFGTLLGRKRNEEELDRHVAEWTKTQDEYELMHRLQAAGVPAGVVQNAQDVLERDVNLRERGYFWYLDHPEAGRTAYDGPGFRLSRTPGRLGGPAPCLGAHTAQICQDIIGMDDDEMSEMVMAGVLQ
ncbi:MAG TPA: CoA transferase [Dehalococcoidia bacterium]|nr:CoA transferase [Dehalococcoidia bacterium]